MTRNAHVHHPTSGMAAAIAVLIALLLTAACTPLVGTPTPAATPEAAQQPPNSVDARTPYNGADVVPGRPIPDAVAERLLYDLASGDEAVVGAALQAIQTGQDARFVPVLIELLRFGQIGLTLFSGEHVTLLEQLSGQSLGSQWAGWIEWYGRTELSPPPGFTTWKGAVLARIDPRFADFLQGDFPSTIRAEEIQWGGVVVDGIPALDHATMIAAQAATYLDGVEPVFGLEINGDARAYPLRIMDWHEMANDTVGGVPVSLAYCTLCGAAIAYDGRASDGNTYDFGSSGFLFRSNKLMYDRQTRTLWNQLTGEPVLGPLAGSDVTLPLLPVVLTTWDSWRAQHPDTLVLDIETGFNRPYEVGAAYGDYFSDPETMFPVWQRSDLLDTKAQIYALRVEGTPVAYPVAALADEQVINDTIGGANVVVIAQSDPVGVAGVSRRTGPVAYSAGSEVRAYERNDHRFVPGGSPLLVMDERGHAWQVTEEALVAADGRTLPRLNGHLAYWFGWYSFFPQTLVYGEPAD